MRPSGCLSLSLGCLRGRRPAADVHKGHPQLDLDGRTLMHSANRHSATIARPRPRAREKITSPHPWLTPSPLSLFPSILIKKIDPRVFPQPVPQPSLRPLPLLLSLLSCCHSRRESASVVAFAFVVVVAFALLVVIPAGNLLFACVLHPSKSGAQFKLRLGQGVRNRTSTNLVRNLRLPPATPRAGNYFRLCYSLPTSDPSAHPMIREPREACKREKRNSRKPNTISRIENMKFHKINKSQIES